MDQSEIDSVFAHWKNAYSKLSWTPIVGTPADNNATSWFGGRPCLPAGTEWPACGDCRKSMSFLVQIDLAGLPQDCNAPLKAGLLQLFYCSSDDGQCETWMPFSGAHKFLVSPASTTCTEAPAGVAEFAKVAIAGWNQSVDYPHPEEHENCGLTYDYDFERRLVDVVCSEYSIELKKIDIDIEIAEQISNATPGDKLGGWPYWVQSVEYPNCPECANQMEMFMQIDSEVNLDYMFGDSGCAHIYQCRDHPGLFGFGWACC